MAWIGLKMSVAQLTTVVSQATITGRRTCAIIAATTSSRERPGTSST
jgi:hypothetical protein